MSVINIGGVDFRDFEIPDEIHLGGAHAGRLWKLPGGVRIFDAQGPDDDPIKWNGRFRGSNALSRAQQLDSLRRSGQQLPFSVLGLSYTVYIKHFGFRPKHAMEIPYSIELEVIEDLGQGLFSGFIASIDTLVNLDIVTGSALVDSIDPNVSLALSDFTASVGTASPLAAASFSALIPVKTAGQSLEVGLVNAIAAQDALIAANPFEGFDLDPDGFLSSMTAVQNSNALLDARGYLGRAVTNIENATG